jgi:penicillin amidase
MGRSLAALFVCALSIACRRTEPAPPPLVVQVAGTLDVAGLSAPVRIVRDRWGVPHIYAQSQDDLFVAQGFVQAQDRLFQMDLWRRSVQGRLAQVLGPNFVERDANTRRIQYRGDLAVEWASYGPDTLAIASAFVRGVNAWVVLAREHPPEEFVRAGWKPELWSPVDLLNRTDAFVESGDAIDEVRREHMSEVIVDAIRRVGTPPFFAGSIGVQPDRIAVRSTGHVEATRAGVLALAEARPTLDHPSRRYFVHLNAPGWNVAGATAPWRPGVAVGHNDRIAWGMAPIDVDTQRVYAEPDTAPKVVVQEPIVIKGRAQPFVFGLETTAHGLVFASDRARHLVYTLQWSGTQPGAAPELASLALDRARTPEEFRAALARWKMPARRVVYVDADGHVGESMAAVGERRDRRPGPAPPARVSDQAVVAHPLGVFAATAQRFTIGPLPRPTGDDSPLRGVFDAKDWDRSRAIHAPGQSESPASPHFSDLAKLWSAGELVPLAFGDAAVQANTESTLTLVTARR